MALTKAGEYHLIRKLGSGGMGDVYLGVSATADYAAVKTIHPHLLKAVFGSRVARLENADLYADPPWLAIEFVDGLTLRQYVERHGVLTVAEAAMIGAMLAERDPDEGHTQTGCCSNPPAPAPACWRRASNPARS